MPLDELKVLIESDCGRPGWVFQWLQSVRRRSLFPDSTCWTDHGRMTPHFRAAFKALPPERRRELIRWKAKRFHPKIAKWIYRNLAPDQTGDDSWASRELLLSIAHFGTDVPWRRGFFWNEICRLKGHEFGMWVIEAMAPLVATYDDAPRFIALYGDEEAHPMVRGEAIFGLAYVSPHHDQQPPRLDRRWTSLTRATCRRALTDTDNPYARAGGCFLVKWIGGFEKELKELASDDTPVWRNWHPVSMYAKGALECA